MKKGLVLLLFTCALVPYSLRAAPSNKLLTIGVSQEFASSHPLVNSMVAGTLIYYAVGRPLDAIDADWKWRCYLCKTIPTLENGLAKIVTEKGSQKLRTEWEIIENARWGDGVPVTAKDFKLAWEVGKSPHVSVPNRDQFDMVESMEIDPKNPKRFTLIYREARFDYYMLGNFYLLPSHIEGRIWEKTKGTPEAYEKQTAYVSAPTTPGLYLGPYIVQEMKAGSHTTLVPNPYFYGTKPKIEKIIFKLVQNTQTLEANLLSGTIDMISELGMTFDQALSLDKRSRGDPAMKDRFRVEFRQGTIYEHIDLNFRAPVFKDIRLRRALVYAIDRERMVQALFDGKQKVAIHSIHPLDPYFTDDVMKYPYDPTKAAALLDEAGWKPGADGFRQKNGERLALTLMTTAGDKTRELVEVFLQNEWKKVGIELRIKNEPGRVLFGETLRKGLFPHMIMYAFSSAPDNPPRSMMHSTEIPTAQNGYKGQNRGAYVNPKMDSALDAVKLELNFEKRKSLMGAVQREYASDVPVISLYMRAEVVVVPTNLQGFRVSGHQYYSTLAVEDWNLN